MAHLSGKAPGLGSAAAPGAAGGDDGVDRLPTVHAVNLDNARGLMALQRDVGGRQAAAAGGGGGGGARISFSGDRMQLRISGLAVRPQKLHRREDDKQVRVAQRFQHLCDAYGTKLRRHVSRQPFGRQVRNGIESSWRGSRQRLSLWILTYSVHAFGVPVDVASRFRQPASARSWT